MSPPGGGKVNRPTQAQQILHKALEKTGDKPKKLDTQQQSQQLQDQARTQESLRQAVESKTGEEGPGMEGERAEGREGTPEAPARHRGEAAEEGSKVDRQMDGFLARSSQQQKTREAGKELTRDRLLNSHGPQSWTVSTSSQASPKARQAILARQTQQTLSQQPGSQTRGPQTPLPQMTRVFTTANLPQPPLRNMKSPESQGPTIQYAPPLPQPGPESGRSRTSRNFLTQNLFQQLAQLAVRAQGQGTQAAQAQKAQVVVQIRGPFLFVKDGKKIRTFKLEKDGSLSEIPSEDSSDQPLSSDARAAIRKVLARKGLLKGGEEKTLGETEDISEAQLAEIIAEQKAQLGGDGEPSLDFETKFALLLYKVLEEHKNIEKKLGSGEDPHFPDKKDWEAFFSGLAQLGNKEKAGKKSLEEILGLIFRGLFNKKGKGKYLVGDLKYSKSGKNREEKFAQLAVENQELLNFLSKLQPGQKISTEILQGLFGEELSYLIMAHTGEEIFNMAGGAEKNVIFNPKAAIDPFSQARLEKTLFSRPKKESALLKAAENAAQEAFPQKNPAGIFANVYELMGLRRSYEGRPKLYTILAWLALASVVGIGIALTLLHLL